MFIPCNKKFLGFFVFLNFRCVYPVDRESKNKMSQIWVLLDDGKIALKAIDRNNFEVEFRNVLHVFAV